MMIILYAYLYDDIWMTCKIMHDNMYISYVMCMTYVLLLDIIDYGAKC